MIRNSNPNCWITIDLIGISPAELDLIRICNSEYFLDWEYNFGYMPTVPDLLEKRIITNPEELIPGRDPEGDKHA